MALSILDHALSMVEGLSCRRVGTFDTTPVRRMPCTSNHVVDVCCLLANAL